MTPELALILVVVIFSFWIKAVAGFGGPLLAIPILAPFLGVEQSIVVISLANLVANLLLLWSNRAAARPNRQLLTRLIVAGALATVGGTVILTRLDDVVLSLILAASVFVYIVVNLAHPEFEISRERGLALAVPVGILGGIMHGTTGNSGTVFGSFYHSLKMPRDEFVFSLTVTFLGFGLLQIITLASLGSFNGPQMTQALIAIIPIWFVTRWGESFSRGLDPKVFSKIVLGLLAVSAIALIAGALL